MDVGLKHRCLVMKLPEMIVHEFTFFSVFEFLEII